MTVRLGISELFSGPFAAYTNGERHEHQLHHTTICLEL